MSWSIPFPSARGRAAMRRLMEPSLPRPLEGSSAVGPNQWWYPKPATKVRELYLSASAPVPPEASLQQQSDDVIRVVTPMRNAAILVTDSRDACVYTIVGAPTVRLQGGGLIHDVDAFVRVAAFPFDPTGMGFIAQVDVDGAPWLISVAPHDKKYTLVLAPGPMPTTFDIDFSKEKLQAPCDVRIDDGVVVASATISDKEVSVRVRITDAFASIMPEVPATLTISKKWGRHGSRPRLKGTGFDEGERIALTLGEHKLAGTTAERHGRFEKGFQVPADFPIGHTQVTASGARSKRVASVPYEIRPPKK